MVDGGAVEVVELAELGEDLIDFSDLKQEHEGKH